MHEIYQEIENIESQYARGNIDPRSIYHYRSLVFQVKEPKRFFDTMIKYEFYNKGFDIQQTMFSACSIFGQKTIYNRYMPHFLPRILASLAQQKADYLTWYHYIDQWIVLNKYTQSDSNHNGLALHFIATLVVLEQQQDKQDLYHAIINHPIYKNMLRFCRDFFQSHSMEYIDQLHDILFPHIQKLRKSNNFNDPWLDFYRDFRNDTEYQAFTAPYYQYMDKHDILYHDKFIFCMDGDRNVGDCYWFVQYVIHWSLHHNIPIIALLTPNQSAWIGEYFKDYFDAILIRDADITIPKILSFMFPEANHVGLISLYSDYPPYYMPRSNKRHCNHYTHDHLYDKNADIGNPVPIMPATEQIMQENQTILKAKGLNPERTILIAPHGNAINMHAMSNFTLRDFWHNLVVRLQNEGFTPVINLSHANEQHYLTHAEQIYLPLRNMVDFVNNIGFFIGVRSGLCDLLISSDNPKKYCVSPIEYVDWGDDLAPWFYLANLTFDDIPQHIDDIVASMKGQHVKSLENHQCYGYFTMADLS